MKFVIYYSICARVGKMKAIQKNTETLDREIQTDGVVLQPFTTILQFKYVSLIFFGINRLGSKPLGGRLSIIFKFKVKR